MGKRKLCNEPGCKKQQNYVEGGKQGKCAEHGGRPICSEIGCENRVNFTKDGRKDMCARHGGKPNLVKNMCNEEGCHNQENYKSGGIRMKCARHGGIPKCTEITDKGVCNNIQQFQTGGVRGRCGVHGGIPACTEPDCDTPQAYKKGGVVGKCIVHGGFPICTVEGCTSAQQNRGGRPDRCYKHGGASTCTFENCGISTVFREGGLRRRCARHGGIPLCTFVLDDNRCQNVQEYREGGERYRCGRHGGIPQCLKPDCDLTQKYLEGGTHGYCAKHGGYPLCTESGCTNPQNYRGGERGKCGRHGGVPKVSCKNCGDEYISIYNKKECLCRRCYANLNPNKADSKRYLMKELYIRKDFQEYIRTTEFKTDFEPVTYNKTLGACSKRRPDIFVDCYTHVVIIEVDEDQHRSYDSTCEVSRINELYSDVNYRPIVFIRFNPDKYTDEEGVRHKSVFRITKTGFISVTTAYEERLSVLKEEFVRRLVSQPSDPIETIELFYTND